MKPLEVFTSLDLEMNKTDTDNKIIQIGATVGDIITGQILDTLSIYINPNEKLNPYIVNLTGIEQIDVDNGVSLEDGYLRLKAFHEKYGSFVNAIVWGGGDSLELYNQLKKEGIDLTDNWCFGRRWIDVKTLFISWRIANGLPIQGGLAKSMTKVGLNFIGRKHNAKDDSLNTFRMYFKLLELLKQPANNSAATST